MNLPGSSQFQEPHHQEDRGNILRNWKRKAKGSAEKERLGARCEKGLKHCDNE